MADYGAHIESLPVGDQLHFVRHDTRTFTTTVEDAGDPNEYAIDFSEEERQKCCSCCWVIDEFFHHTKKGAELAFVADPETCPLPKWATDMMLQGHVNTAIVLGIYYSPQQGGSENKKLPAEGEPVEIRGAYGLEPEEVTYLGYCGKTYASCGFWQGSDHSGRTLIYVNLNALVPAGIIPLACASFTTTDPQMWNGNEFPILDFTNRCLSDLWQSHGVREYLFGANGLVWQYPGARFIFCGYSHGTPMSQALALLFCIERERLRSSGQFAADPPEVYIIAWNGYRWTNDIGQDLASKHLGDHAVVFVSVRRYKGHAHFDPTSGYPPTGANSRNLYAIDVDTSLIEKISAAPDTSHATGAKLSLQWLAMHSIHIKAIRRLAAVYGGKDESAEESDSECDE